MGKIICIGGPLDGAFYDDSMHELRGVIPDMYEKWFKPGEVVGEIRLLEAKYRRTTINIAVGSLEVSGVAYVWEFCRDSHRSALMKVLASIGGA